MSRVTTITLSDDLYSALQSARVATGGSMARIIRRALERDLVALRARPHAEGMRGRRRHAPPASVFDWLAAPLGAFAHLLRTKPGEPTDWNPDELHGGLDTD